MNVSLIKDSINEFGRRELLYACTFEPEITGEAPTKKFKQIKLLTKSGSKSK